VYLYINGSLVSSAAKPSMVSTSGQSTYVAGCNAGLDLPSNGKFGKIAIYNRALSASEVLQNFNADRSRYGV
jgi:hypothetical protein